MYDCGGGRCRLKQLKLSSREESQYQPGSSMLCQRAKGLGHGDGLQHGSQAEGPHAIQVDWNERQIVDDTHRLVEHDGVPVAPSNTRPSYRKYLPPTMHSSSHYCCYYLHPHHYHHRQHHPGRGHRTYWAPPLCFSSLKIEPAPVKVRFWTARQQASAALGS